MEGRTVPLLACPAVLILTQGGFILPIHGCALSGANKYGGTRSLASDIIYSRFARSKRRPQRSNGAWPSTLPLCGKRFFPRERLQLHAHATDTPYAKS